METQIMFEIRRNHAILLYESMKLRELLEQIELSFTVVATETSAIWINPDDPKPVGFENGTIFHISEKVKKDGQPFKHYKRNRLKFLILDNKKLVVYDCPN